MSDLDQLNPGMGTAEAGAEMPGDTAGGQEHHLELSPEDKQQQGKMAKADLYKLASYSHKLFKQLHDDDELENWVEAKITKAADYIATVYHYLEYEMKVNEFGKHLNDAEITNEQRAHMETMLSEAKMKIAELKKTQAVKMLMREEKSSTGGDIDRSKPGVVKHKHNPDRFSDEPHSEPASKAKGQSSAEKKAGRDMDKEENKRGKEWEKKYPGSRHIYKAKDDSDDGIDESMEDCEHCGGSGQVAKTPPKAHPDHAEKINKYKTLKNAVKAIVNDHSEDGEMVPEGKKSKPDFLDLDKDGNKKEPMKKAAADKKKMSEAKAKCCCEEKGKAKCPVHGKVEESKPSAGLSAAKKSATVKKAKSGGDIGKPGKNFDKLAKKAGGGEKGEKIAAAAMWKNIKETTAYIEEKKAIEKKADKDYDGDGKVESPKDEVWGSRAKAAAKAGHPFGKKETVKESTEVDRMRELTGRLNRNENIINESREADTFRKLTNILKG